MFTCVSTPSGYRVFTGKVERSVLQGIRATSIGRVRLEPWKKQVKAAHHLRLRASQLH